MAFLLVVQMWQIFVHHNASCREVVEPGIFGALDSEQ